MAISQSAEVKTGYICPMVTDKWPPTKKYLHFQSKFQGSELTFYIQRKTSKIL
jgi:hypothetical protein